MRWRWLLCTAISLALAEAGAAEALTRATLQLTLQGVPLTFSSTSAAGTFAGGRFTLEPGSWFATNYCVGARPGCVRPAAPFAAPVTGLGISFGHNGGIDATTQQTAIAPCCGSGIAGEARVHAKIGKAPSFTLLALPLSFGAGITGTGLNPPSLSVVVFGDSWHLGPVTLTGISSQFAPLPDVMATGNVVWDPLGSTVTLVSLNRVRIRGLANSSTAMPVFLTLAYTHDHSLPISTWFCPEPRESVMLGASGLTLFAIGWRRRARSA